MKVKDIIQARGIAEVLHFTTHKGLLGILHSGFVKSRKRLPAEVQLEYIYTPNAIYRKDRNWLDYVNLSITRINHQFFTSSCRWHRESELWWCILSFDPVILTHSSVHFATTNNFYPSVIRGVGAAGLENLFATRVAGRYGNIQQRPTNCDDAVTTCNQAEVLYPKELSIDFLQRIYVENGDDEDEVHAQLALVGKSLLQVVVDPEKFRMV